MSHQCSVQCSAESSDTSDHFTSLDEVLLSEAQLFSQLTLIFLSNPSIQILKTIKLYLQLNLKFLGFPNECKRPSVASDYSEGGPHLGK